MIPLGGADSIGRSCYLYLFHRMLGKPFVVMVDAGLAPGAPMLPETYEEEALPLFGLAEQGGLTPDAIVITHGHLDHVGALIFAAKRFPNTPVFMSRETKMFTRLHLEEGLKLLKNDQDSWDGATLPYDEGDVHRLMKRITVLNREKPVVTLSDDIVMHVYRAGHIVGAEMFVFSFGPHGDRRSVVHTGDVSVHDQALVRGAKIPHFRNVEALVHDSTNLGVNHDRHAEWERLVLRMNLVLSDGGMVLLPTFALHRAQELLERFLSESFAAHYPIHVFGPSLSDFTVAYRELCPNRPFGSVKVVGEYGWTREARRTIARKEPCVIIASGGMGNGAASVCTEELLYHGRGEDAYFSTGWFDECSVSGKVHAACGAQSPNDRFVFLGPPGKEKKYPVRGLRMGRFHLSGHAYQRESEEVLWRGVSPRRIVCVHGEKKPMHTFIAARPTFEGIPLIASALEEEIELA